MQWVDEKFLRFPLRYIVQCLLATAAIMAVLTLAGWSCGVYVAEQAPQGSACTLDSQCSTGFCRDGYCCNNTCTSSCRACNLPGLLGTCSYHAATTDPEAECGVCSVCDGTGTCMAATAGTDPKAECAQALQSTCQLDGQCNGSGACRLWPSGTVCVTETCASHVHNPITKALSA